MYISYELTSCIYSKHTKYEILPYAYLDDVPKAVMSACRRPVMKMKGFFRVMTKYSVGKIMMPWIMSPMITVTVYIPNCPPICVMSSISTIFPAIKNRIPTGAYLT